MNAVRLALAGVLVLGLAIAARAADKDDKKADSVKDKIVGTWEVEEGKGLAKGTKVQFTKDGKLVITGMRDGEERKLEGTYKVDGSTLKVTHKRDGEDHTQEIKVTKLDSKQLVT